MTRMARKPSIRIAIVEDQPRLLARLIQMVAQMPHANLAWQASALATARQAIHQDTHPADVAIIDIGLPDGSGLDLLAQLPHTRVLMYSVLGDEQNVVRALERGAAGYLLKDAPVSEILNAIDSVLNGGAPLTPSVAAHLLKRLKLVDASPTDTASHAATNTSPVKHTALESLTPRENDVLLALARGYSYEESAKLLGISPHTVGHHVKQIYGKLAVNSRSEAVFEAMQAGWLQRDR
jgi:DNA-binding NarL/FixJ family response regulator